MLYTTSNNISYNNNNVIVTISPHIKNPGIARTVYSCIFRHTEDVSTIFSDIRLVEAYSDIIEV